MLKPYYCPQCGDSKSVLPHLPMPPCYNHGWGVMVMMTPMVPTLPAAAPVEAFPFPKAPFRDDRQGVPAPAAEIRAAWADLEEAGLLPWLRGEDGGEGFTEPDDIDVRAAVLRIDQALGANP